MNFKSGSSGEKMPVIDRLSGCLHEREEILGRDGPQALIGSSASFHYFRFNETSRALSRPEARLSVDSEAKLMVTQQEMRITVNRAV